VGLEVLAVLAHLFERRVLYRDLKPSNLMLDSEGHVRLIDFGTSTMSADPDSVTPPTSSEYCGSRPYMAPEIAGIEDFGWQPYTCACDYYSYGVMLYELAEGCYPYGDDPAYESAQDEFVQPELVDDAGSEVPHLYDLLVGLLDWDPDERTGGTAPKLAALKSSPYWRGADWELVDARKVASPLLALVGSATSARDSHQSQPPSAEEAQYIDELVKHWHETRRQQLMVQEALEVAEANGTELSFVHQQLGDHEQMMCVEGWEFCSEQALAQEYALLAA